MTKPIVKGWCPGAHRPMMSGDGLVVRVRPFRAELTAAQGLALCAQAGRYGNGTLELTSRANLQIRGVTQADHPALLQELDALGLIDPVPAIEGHRNILLAPDWQPGGLTARLYDELLQQLSALPVLPEKMGFALDTGGTACLAGGSADFRFELSEQGELILRADGAARGRRISESGAMAALEELAQWFVATGGPEHGRMARHLKHVSLPTLWQDVPPRPTAAPFTPGPVPGGMILGVPFGAIPAPALAAVLADSGAESLRLMLGRHLWLRGATPDAAPGFVTAPGSALMTTHACPGTPFCPQATVETRALAARLAGTVPGPLHVSGCAKGCALPRTAALTLTGRAGRFDLIRDGAPWDAPMLHGLDPDDILPFLSETI